MRAKFETFAHALSTGVANLNRLAADAQGSNLTQNLVFPYIVDMQVR